jgi:general secretion pathway protein M
MRRWLESLEPRERVMLAAGGVAAAIIVAWTLIWSPLSNRAAELGETVAQKQRMLASLQRARALEMPDVPGVDASLRQSLVLLIDQTHKGYGLTGTLVRNQPDGQDGIRVTFEDAGFDALIAWLGTLQSSYAVSVESATLDGGRSPGIVNATLVLRRS